MGMGYIVDTIAKYVKIIQFILEDKRVPIEVKLDIKQMLRSK